jgi:regulator of chromosome condensation
MPLGMESEVDEIPDSQSYNFVKLAAGDSISLGLTAEGRVYAWGTFRGDQNGQLGFSANIAKQLTPVLLTGPVFDQNQFVDIAAGDNHALALTSRGVVYAWGNSEQGQAGFRTHRPISGLSPKRLNFRRRKVVKIACGSFHSMVIDAAGDLWAFGLNNFGQCGRHPSIDICWDPAFISLPEGRSVVDCAGGEHHSIALLDNGQVICFGKTEGYELGLGYMRMNDAGKLTNEPIFDEYKDERTGRVIRVERTKSCIHRPTINPYLSNVVSLAVGTHHNIAIDKSNRAYYWGLNINGQLGNASSWMEDDGNDQKTPVAYDFSKSGALVILAGCGAQHSVILVCKPST